MANLSTLDLKLDFDRAAEVKRVRDCRGVE
jgi:hypothetical protein